MDRKYARSLALIGIMIILLFAALSCGRNHGSNNNGSNVIQNAIDMKDSGQQNSNTTNSPGELISINPDTPSIVLPADLQTLLDKMPLPKTIANSGSRNKSTIVDDTILGKDYITKSDNAQVIGDYLQLNSGNIGDRGSSWGVYQIGGYSDSATVLSFNVFLTNIQYPPGNAQGFYLGLSDFSNNTWRWVGPFTLPEIQIDVEQQANFFSFLGNSYFALAVWDGAQITHTETIVRVDDAYYPDNGDADTAPLIKIPYSEFWLGASPSDPLAEEYEKPGQMVFLPEYYIQKYEVTNAQFKKFIDAGGYSNQSVWSEQGWKWRTANNVTAPLYWFTGEYNSGPDCPDFPVVGICWFEAEAYATWAGMRLPTFAEWQKAARGTSDQRIYPWGNECDASKLNSNANVFPDLYATTSPVGSFPLGASPYGCMDMAGNVWEIMLDEASPDPLPSPFYPTIVSLTDVETSTVYVICGGSFGSNVSVSSRLSYNLYDPVNHTLTSGSDSRDGSNRVGFRCVYMPNSIKVSDKIEGSSSDTGYFFDKSVDFEWNGADMVLLSASPYGIDNGLDYHRYEYDDMMRISMGGGGTGAGLTNFHPQIPLDLRNYFSAGHNTCRVVVDNRDGAIYRMFTSWIVILPKEQYRPSTAWAWPYTRLATMPTGYRSGGFDFITYNYGLWYFIGGLPDYSITMNWGDGQFDIYSTDGLDAAPRWWADWVAPGHAYDNPGTYTITMYGDDALGNPFEGSHNVTVNQDYIVYERNGKIYRCKPDGTGSELQLATGYNPTISFDRKWVAYDRNWVIYKIPIDGGTEERVTTAIDGYDRAFMPRFAHRVLSITFLIDKDSIPQNGGATSVCIIDLDGTDYSELTTDSMFSNQKLNSPTFNPEYGRVAFFWDTKNEIWSVNLDGTDAQKEISNCGSHFDWAYSTTGISRFVFERDQPDNYNAVLIKDGEASERILSLSDRSGEQFCASLSPDGGSVAYHDSPSQGATTGNIRVFDIESETDIAVATNSSNANLDW